MAADVGSLNVKLTADGAQLDKDLKAANAAIKGFSGAVQTGLGATKAGADLMRGSFETAGGAMKKMGEIAGLIPGPWGQAAGAVLSIGGDILDFFNRKLIRSQEAARQGFLNIASGARTVDQAVSDIHLGALTEGIDRIVRREHNRGQAGVLGNLLDLRGGLGGGVGGVAAQAETDESRIVRNSQQRERLMRDLLANPQLTALRGQMAGEQVGQQMTDLARAPILGQAQRTVSRSLRGQHEFSGGAVFGALMDIGMDQFTRQNLTPTAAQFQALQLSAYQTTEALRRQANILGQQRIMDQAQEQGRQLTQGLRTPLERFGEEMDYYTGLLNLGGIGEETFNRATEHAVAELERSADQYHATGAVMADSAAAASAAARFAQQGPDTAAGRAERLNLLVAQQTQEAQRARVAAEELVRILSGGQQSVFGFFG